MASTPEARHLTRLDMRFQLEVGGGGAVVVFVGASADFDASSSHLDLHSYSARLSCLPLEVTFISTNLASFTIHIR